MFTDIGFTGGSAGYGMMYHAGKKTGKTDNDVMVDEMSPRLRNGRRRLCSRLKLRSNETEDRIDNFVWGYADEGGL